MKLQEYKQHLDSRCKSFIVNADSPSKVTLKDVIRKSTSTPATPAETKAAQNLIRRLINQGNSDSNTPGVLKVSTSGQLYENNNETSAYMYYIFCLSKMDKTLYLHIQEDITAYGATLEVPT